MSQLKHLETVQNFKNALETMVAEGEIRADYANQLIRLMRSGMPSYAAACGFGGGFDFVLRSPVRPSLTRREVEAQIAANPTPTTTQKKSVEHVGAGSPVIEVQAEAEELIAAVPSYTLEGLAAEFGITDWEATTLKQADALRALATSLGISFGNASKPFTIAQKIVAAYA